MRQALVVVSVVAGFTVLPGCFPLALALAPVAGVGLAVAEDVAKGIDKTVREQEAKASLRRQQEQAQKAEVARRQAAEEERARRAEYARREALAKAKAEEERRRAEARRLEEDRVQEAERSKAVAIAEQEAKVEMLRQAESKSKKLVSDMAENLANGHWNRDLLGAFLKAATDLDAHLTRDTRAKMHLVVGLYAWYLDDVETARRHFLKAKQEGATDPKIVVPDRWTPGAAVAFQGA